MYTLGIDIGSASSKAVILKKRSGNNSLSRHSGGDGHFGARPRYG